MRYLIENELIRVEVESLGAELKSMVKKETGLDYMWCADPKYYKRTSPNLFPIVGSLNGGVYRYKNQEYKMGQHGFARDMEWDVEKKSNTELWFYLSSDSDTLERYPFVFKLALGYQLDGTSLKVIWRVKNTDDRTMYFSCGGHPCFTCPIHGEKDKTGYSYNFHTEGDVIYHPITKDGMMKDEFGKFDLVDGKATLTPDFFDNGAYIVEDDQIHKVSLTDPSGHDYLTVTFEDAPLFGLWSAEGKNAPYAAIEPWYGRCDRAGFHGSLEEREWGHALAAGHEFTRSYTITVEK